MSKFKGGKIVKLIGRSGSSKANWHTGKRVRIRLSGEEVSM